jgi:hypothetical protein
MSNDFQFDVLYAARCFASAIKELVELHDAPIRVVYANGENDAYVYDFTMKVDRTVMDDYYKYGKSWSDMVTDALLDRNIRYNSEEQVFFKDKHEMFILQAIDVDLVRVFDAVKDRRLFQ